MVVALPHGGCAPHTPAVSPKLPARIVYESSYCHLNVGLLPMLPVREKAGTATTGMTGSTLELCVEWTKNPTSTRDENHLGRRLRNIPPSDADDRHLGLTLRNIPPSDADDFHLERKLGFLPRPLPQTTNPRNMRRGAVHCRE